MSLSSTVQHLWARCLKADSEPILEIPALSETDLSALEQSLVHAGWFCAVIDGSQLHDKKSLLAAMAKALHFPGYFGYNWDALTDCWSDMSWKPAKGYLCVLKHAAVFEKSAPQDLATFKEVAAGVSQRGLGRQPPELFRVLLIHQAN